MDGEEVWRDGGGTEGQTEGQPDKAVYTVNQEWTKRRYGGTAEGRTDGEEVWRNGGGTEGQTEGQPDKAVYRVAYLGQKQVTSQ